MGGLSQLHKVGLRAKGIRAKELQSLSVTPTANTCLSSPLHLDPTITPLPLKENGRSLRSPLFVEQLLGTIASLPLNEHLLSRCTQSPGFPPFVIIIFRYLSAARQPLTPIDIRGIVVHPTSNDARAFYLKLGFAESSGDPRLIVVTLKDAR